MASVFVLIASSINIQTILIGFITLGIIWYATKDLRRNLPPGPWGLPVVGILPYMGKQPHEVLTRYGKQYGPVFSGKMGGRLTIFLNDYTSIRQMFAKSGDLFADRPNIVIIDAFTSGKGLVMGYMRNNQKEKRRFAMKMMRSFGMGKSSFESTIVDEIEYLNQNLMEFADRDEYCDPKHLLENSVSNVICRIVFGKRFEYDDPKFKKFLKSLYSFLENASFAAAMNFIPILKYFPGNGWNVLSNASAVFFDEFIVPELDDHRKKIDIDNPCDFIDEFIKEKLDQEQSGAESDAFDKESAKEVVGDLFAAGTETTSSTLKWSLLYLALNPEIQTKVHRELDSVIGRERRPTLKDQPMLVYCQAVVMEALRIRPAVPLGIPHAATEDTTFEGYTIPKEAPIISNIWAVMHDTNTWQEPDHFKPERFIDASGCLIRRNEFIPFSIGRRVCLGEQLADMALFLFFTHLLYAFEFKLPEDRTPPTTTPNLGVTLTPNPFEVVIVKREVKDK